MHLAGVQLRGDIDVDLKLRRADLKRRLFVADASTVRVRKVGFGGPGGIASRRVGAGDAEPGAARYRSPDQRRGR